jgi:hypothetical protein
LSKPEFVESRFGTKYDSRLIVGVNLRGEATRLRRWHGPALSAASQRHIVGENFGSRTNSGRGGIWWRSRDREFYLGIGIQVSLSWGVGRVCKVVGWVGGMVSILR